MLSGLTFVKCITPNASPYRLSRSRMKIPRRVPIPATGVHDLLGRPVGEGMSGHPNLQDLPGLVVHHEEDVQRPEEHRPHAEEVARPDVLGMARQELPPTG